MGRSQTHMPLAAIVPDRKSRFFAGVGVTVSAREKWGKKDEERLDGNGGDRGDTGTPGTPTNVTT